MPSDKSSTRVKASLLDDWQFVTQEEAAERFGCGTDTVKTMVDFEAAGVLPSFPAIGLKKQICPELMKHWLMEMASTEDGRRALRDLKAQNRHK